MTLEQFHDLTPEQRTAMRDLHLRSGMEWDQFMEKAIPPTDLFPYVGVPEFHGMFVGIERDGYTHS